MKRVLIFFIGGIVASTAGFFIGLPFSNRLLRWVIVGACISIFCHGFDVSSPNSSKTTLMKGGQGGIIGGLAIVSGWFFGKYITYTMVAWPFFGIIIGLTDPSKIGVITRIKKTVFGFAGGFIGVHFFPFLFFGIFPFLGLPFMAWDIEKMGLILSGGTVALGIALGGKKR
ncbi:MAG: hypothetical protein HY578_06820 [Nitrospinae bacterium]|nr:hypothetical protein [Nitrospinota bacterium]